MANHGKWTRQEAGRYTSRKHGVIIITDKGGKWYWWPGQDFVADSQSKLGAVGPFGSLAEAQDYAETRP